MMAGKHRRLIAMHTKLVGDVKRYALGSAKGKMLVEENDVLSHGIGA